MPLGSNGLVRHKSTVGYRSQADARWEQRHAATGAEPAPQDILSFGPFRLHIAQRKIEKDGGQVQLSSRAFDVLVTLIEQAGAVVSKNELMARVWPGVTVDEGSLRVHVAALRKALGDGEAGARYLSTVSGQGYCFVAQVSRSDDAEPSLLTPAPSPAHNLPRRQLQMVGRDQAVDDVLHKLTSKRFVTIVGPGGIGKTTVAVSAGHALLAQFAGQVRFVDLGAIQDATLVPGIVASALGVVARSSDPADSLAAFMRDKRMLLILDCCEHVIEASAALTERLYKEAPQLHILATSRELLRVEGEHIHRLLPLASPPEDAALTAADALAFPAVELFVERALANSSEFELTDANASDVGRICRRLDGIALAIELTASRVCAYGVKPMIALLDNQFNMLWEGRRTALPRHRTLRATIEWSYNLLSEQERTILCRLSAFSGNFTLDAARSVAATDETDDAAIIPALASLVAKSMLTLNTSSVSARYRLLDATRAYAQEKLAASSGADITARNHACYFLALLKRIGDGSIDDLSAIADQFGNIRGALTWCFSARGDRATGVALAAASMPLFFQLSLLAECQLWATRAIEALDGVDGSITHDLALHAALGSARILTGQIDDSAAACFTRALGLAEKIGDVPGQLRLIGRLHLLQLFAGDLDAALNTARRGEAIAASNDDPAALARMRVSLSISCHYLGDLVGSRSYIEAALAHPELEADVHGGLSFDYPRRAQITLARILWLQGYPDRAMETARQAIADVITVDHPVKLCRALLWAFGVFYWNQELEDYEQHIDRLLVETRKYALDSLRLFGEATKGITLLARGEVDVGLVMLRGAVEKMQNHRFGAVAGLSAPLAVALAATDRGDEALTTIDQAIAHARHRNFLMEMPDMLRAKGEVLTRMKSPDLSRAEHWLKESLELAHHQGALGYELRAGVSLARLWRQQGRPREAHGMLAPIHGRFTEGFDSPWLRTAEGLLKGLLDELS
jgi:predicted ATPase/DNA-binding winged helix-turn-helix (wHTH) protein